MPPVRPPGQGRKARARQRRALSQAGNNNDSTANGNGTMRLQKAPFLHGNTCQGRWQVLDAWLTKLVTDQVPKNSDSDIIPRNYQQEIISTRKTRVLPWRLPPSSGLAIDIGMGDDPITTIELSRALGNQWDVIGTECHTDRLNKAQIQLQNYPNIQAQFSDWSFDISDLINRRNAYDFLLVRALNVFRDYGLEDACRCIHKLCGQLPPSPQSRNNCHDVGGILLEGSCNPSGDFFVLLVLNHKAEILCIVFGTKCFEPQHQMDWPLKFVACLPRIWRHCTEESRSTMPGSESVVVFLEIWKDVCENLGTMGFVESCEKLKEKILSSNESSNKEGSLLGEIDTAYCSTVGVLLWLPKNLSVPRAPELRW